MLSIGKLAPGKHHYYLRSIAEGVEDYYLGAGEAPGRWHGRLAEDLGLRGEVDAAALQLVLGGYHPATGESLFPERPGRRQPTRPGFDVTLSAPKSVSLLYAFGGPDVAAQVVAAHEVALAQTIGYLEDNATMTRRGHAGVDRVSGEGLVVAAFRHRTSRAGDPQLHSHLLVANMTEGVDERFGTLHAALLYLHARTAGFLYQAALRDQLTRSLGVEWTAIENGHAEIAGIPREWIDTHSQRRQQILEAQADQGSVTARSAQLATLATRRPKGRFDVDGETLEQQWAVRALDAGWDPTVAQHTLGRQIHPKVIDGPDVVQLHEHLAGSRGLTEQASTFTRRDVLRAVAEAHGDGAPRHRIEALADDFLDSPAVVPVIDAGSRLSHRDTIRRPDGRVVSGDPNEARYSTPELLAIEHRLVDTALSRANDGVGLARHDIIDAVIAERALAGTPLGEDQEALVRHLTTSGAGVDVVVAKAGTGKTFSLDAARDAWERSGFRVIGASLAGEAADELQRGAGIASSTIDRLLWDLQHGERAGGLPANTVLIVDEAGMAGTRKLAELDAYAAGANAKLVLVGDTRQLPEIDAGGLLRGLSGRLPTLELEHNRRQRHGWDRDTLDELRSGDPKDFIAAYRAQGRFVTGPNAAEVRGQMVTDWWAAFRTDGVEALMSAPRRADVDDLNRRARRHMAEDGRLDGATLHIGNRPFQQGDLVMTRFNDRGLGIRNGTRGWVDAVDPERSTLTMTTVYGQHLTLGPDYLDRGDARRPAVEHGYAATIHKTQGKTAERNFILGDDSVFRELAYSAASRHREASVFYVVAGASYDVELHRDDRPPDPLAEFERALMRSKAKSLAVDSGVDYADVATMSLRQLQSERAALKPAAAVPAEIALAPQQLKNLDRRRDTVSAKVAQLEATEAPPAKLEAAYRELVTLDRARPALTASVARLDEYQASVRPMAERRAALDDSIDRRLGRVLRSVEARPPSYITDALGSRPDRWRDLRLWRQGAVAIEGYRQTWGVRSLGGAAHPLDRALGREPASGTQQAHRVRAGHDALQAIEGLQRTRVIARPGPTLQRPGPG